MFELYNRGLSMKTIQLRCVTIKKASQIGYFET